MDISKIKSQLENLTCPIHGEHPTITEATEDISVECCCNAFKKEIVAKAKEAIKEHTRQDIEQSLEDFNFKI